MPRVPDPLSADLTFGAFLACIRAVGEGAEGDPAHAVSSSAVAVALCDALDLTGPDGGPLRFPTEAAAVAFGRVLWAQVLAADAAAAASAGVRRAAFEESALCWAETGPPVMVERSIGSMDAATFAAYHGLPLSAVYHHVGAQAVAEQLRERMSHV